MRFFRELKTVLFGWPVMQRKCFVENKPPMKNYEEFKGYPYRLDFDPTSGTFVYKPLVMRNLAVAEAPLLFRPKASMPTQQVATKRTRNTTHVAKYHSNA
jgi:hypothetical protein